MRKAPNVGSSEEKKRGGFIYAALVLCVAATPAYAKKRLDIGALDSSSFDSIVATSDQPARMVMHSKMSAYLPGFPGLIANAKLAADSAGFRQKFGIDDPAAEIAREIGATLSEQLSLPMTYVDSGLVIESKGMSVKLRSGEDLLASYGPRKLVVNVATAGWSVSPFVGTRFRMLYGARIEIFDTNSLSFLGKSGCFVPFRSRDQSRELVTMLDNNAESLKAEIKDSVEYCVRNFRENLRGGRTEKAERNGNRDGGR